MVLLAGLSGDRSWDAAAGGDHPDVPPAIIRKGVERDLVPSGDHTGEHCHSPGPCVSRCASDPSDAAVQTSIRSGDRAEQKANREPSGENCGLPSKTADRASGSAGRPRWKRYTSWSAVRREKTRSPERVIQGRRYCDPPVRSAPAAAVRRRRRATVNVPPVGRQRRRGTANHDSRRGRRSLHTVFRVSRRRSPCTAKSASTATVSTWQSLRKMGSRQAAYASKRPSGDRIGR